MRVGVMRRKKPPARVIVLRGLRRVRYTFQFSLIHPPAYPKRMPHNIFRLLWKGVGNAWSSIPLNNSIFFSQNTIRYTIVQYVRDILTEWAMNAYSTVTFGSCFSHKPGRHSYPVTR